MKAKTKFTKLWSILLALAMVVGMLPIAALAAGSATETADFVSTPTKALALLNDAKTGTTASTWDGDTKTLTLGGVNFETTAATAVKLPHGSTIVLTDGTTNTIKGGDSTSASEWCYGICLGEADDYTQGDLTITIPNGSAGTGKLTVIGGNAPKYSHGIYSPGGKVTISGGTVEATGGTAGSESSGIQAKKDVTISSNAKVTAIGGPGNKEGYGIFTQASVIIPDNVNVIASGTMYGIYGYLAVNISGGTVKGTGSMTEGYNYGIFSANDVTISGSAEATSIGHYICRRLKSGGYKVTFNANGGTGTMIFAKGTSGSYEYTLPANGFTSPKGQRFKCWSVGGAEKAAGDKITVTNDTTVTAVWETTTYTVSFAANGGTGSMADVTGVLGEYTLPANGFTAPSGKHFKCWSVDGKEKAAGDKITVTNDTTVTAVWETTTYTVSFAANGGTGTMADVTGILGDYTLPANGFTSPKGQRFKCWSVDGNEKAVGVTITVTENTTLTAVWEYIEYTLTVTDGTASSATATMGTTVTLTANAAPTGKVFDKWVVESGNITLDDTKSPTTTFTMPAGNLSVKATYVPQIPSVAITDVDAPKSNTAFDTEADCNTTGVSNAKPTVTWDSDDDKAGYGKIYTASITLKASEGYKFANSVTATVNGNPATSVTKNANGTLTVTYTFPATDKHNIEITVDTDVRDGDAAKNPTISSGYEIEICFFVEDTDKDGVFINKTGNSITLDDKTMVVDKDLVEAFAAQSGGRFTYESLMDELKDEFDLDELKTEFTGGYDYSFIAMVVHNEGVSFDDDEDGKVTDAIVKVNGKDVTDKCDGGSSLTVNPGAYVFSAAKTYTVSFDANGGSGTMADVTGVLGDYTLPANGFTAPEGKQFKAWSVDGKEKAVGDKITVTADTTVKAVWETLPAAPADYDILNGANSKWTQDSDGNISVRGSGEFSKFVGVKVDGKSVDEKYYTVKEGSTIVTLKPEYLNTLTAGKHTLEIVWTDGTADTTFTVDAKPANTDTKSPQTGDSSSIALWIALLFVSAAGVLSTAVSGKKKKRSARISEGA